jgi:hypothetical protein
MDCIHLLGDEVALNLAPVSGNARDQETLRESPQYVRGRRCLVETTDLEAEDVATAR